MTIGTSAILAIERPIARVLWMRTPGNAIWRGRYSFGRRGWSFEAGRLTLDSEIYLRLFSSRGIADFSARIVVID